MKLFFRENWFFVFTAILLLVASGILLSLYGKETVHLTINKNHSGFGDTLFPWLTHFGEGWAVVPVVLLLTFKNYGDAFWLAVSSIVVSLCIQAGKHFVFPDAPRPMLYFEGIASLHIPEGITPRYHFSFPSGHTAAAFCMYFFLSSLGKNIFFKFSMLALAVSVAYSRMYLSMHFLEDVIGGASIAVVVTSIFLILRRHVRWKWLNLKFSLRAKEALTQ